MCVAANASDLFCSVHVIFLCTKIYGYFLFHLFIKKVNNLTEISQVTLSNKELKLSELHDVPPTIGPRLPSR